MILQDLLGATGNSSSPCNSQATPKMSIFCLIACTLPHKSCQHCRLSLILGVASLHNSTSGNGLLPQALRTAQPAASGCRLSKWLLWQRTMFLSSRQRMDSCINCLRLAPPNSTTAALLDRNLCFGTYPSEIRCSMFYHSWSFWCCKIVCHRELVQYLLASLPTQEQSDNEARAVIRAFRPQVKVCYADWPARAPTIRCI